MTATQRQNRAPILPHWYHIINVDIWITRKKKKYNTFSSEEVDRLGSSEKRQ